MEVKIDSYAGFERDISLADFVASELVGGSYESGVIEKLDCTQDNVVRLLGVLVDLLVENKTLDGGDVKGLLSTYKMFEIVKEE